MASSVEQVTQQEVASLALRERQLAETEAVAHVGRSAWDAGTDEMTWSRELYRIYGVTSGETASQHEFLSRVHPDDRVRVSLALGRATARGETWVEYECRLVRAAHDIRTLHVRQVVRYDAAGHPAHVAGMVQDITEQRRCDEALLANERIHRELTENAFDLVTMLDPDGLIVYVSPAVDRLLGHTPPALIGHQVLAFVHPHDAPRMISALEQVIAQPGVPVVVECRVRHRDTKWRVLESVGQANVDAVGRLRVVVNSRLAAGVRTAGGTAGGTADGTADGTRDASPTRR